MEFTIRAQVLKVDDSVPEDEVVEEKKGGAKEKVEEFKTQVEEVVDAVKTAVKDEL